MQRQADPLHRIGRLPRRRALRGGALHGDGEAMSTAAVGRPLQGWFREWLTTTGDDLLYKKVASSQVMFVRDSLGRALASPWQEWQGEDDSDGERHGGAVTVIGEHCSKSVRLPVYHVALPGLEMVLRDNFYNWRVSVRREKPDDVGGWGLFDEKTAISRCYCEGFPDGWVFGPYGLDRRRFTVEIGTEHDLYAFCLLLRGKR